jgi:hypothetical protein
MYQAARGKAGSGHLKPILAELRDQQDLAH